MAIIATINGIAPMAQRVAHCVGKQYGFKDVSGNVRDATQVEIQQVIIGFLKEIVRGVEAAEKATDPLDLT